MRHLRLFCSVFLLIALRLAVAAAPVATSDLCAATDTLVGAIQGGGERFALGGTLTIEGIVTADFEDDGDDRTYDLRGFFVQDAGDGDSATSDGMFVLTGEPQSYVAVGDRVQVIGVVGESSPRGASETRLKTNGAGIAVCSTDNPLPAPVEITLPFASTAAREQYEGMLVTFPQPLTVTEMYLLGRHGELLLSGGGRLPQPTNVALPGAPAQTVLAANELNQIILDDSNLTEDPDPIAFPPPELAAANTVRGGYLVSGVTGVLTESPGRVTNSGSTTIAFRVRV
ncbi:MAG: hypothetical protein IT319_16420, partial [Anaerolineae bacterium]|nr:hypothetical protein [Anaerolineae bacterium]